MEAAKERAGKKPCSPELLEQLARMRETARKNLLARKQLAEQEAGKAQKHHVSKVSKQAAAASDSDSDSSSDDDAPAPVRKPRGGKRERKYESKYRMLRLEQRMVQLFNENRAPAPRAPSPPKKKEEQDDVTAVAKENIRRRVNDEVLREAFSSIFGNR